MDPKIAEAIGLLRHQIISPVLMDTGPAQMAYFRQMSEREFDVPGRGVETLHCHDDEGVALPVSKTRVCRNHSEDPERHRRFSQASRMR